MQGLCEINLNIDEPEQASCKIKLSCHRQLLFDLAYLGFDSSTVSLAINYYCRPLLFDNNLSEIQTAKQTKINHRNDVHEQSRYKNLHVT